MDNTNCFDLKIFWDEKDGAKSSTDVAYYNTDRLKVDVVNTLDKFKNDGEIFITLRDRIYGVIILSAVIHDLNNLKQSNEYIDLKRFISFAIDDYKSSFGLKTHNFSRVYGSLHNSILNF